MSTLITRRGLILIGSLRAFGAPGNTYYVDSAAGRDQNSGRSPADAWKSLQKAGSVTYKSGDRLLFKRGSVFNGSLALEASGSEGGPVVVDSYGSGALPVINAKGYIAGIRVHNGKHLEIGNLEITSDGGDIQEPGAGSKRYGIWITAEEGTYPHIYLRGLYIHDIFAAKIDENRLGDAIHIESEKTAGISGVRIEDCRIERIAALGIALRGKKDPGRHIADIDILNNKLKDIGGPGIQPSNVTHLVVRGNVVDKSGASSDKRMRGRGSGIWPWGSDDVLIEKNAFMHARGIGDSCGAHIDFECRDVIVQYNLSLDNEGGFVEILGDDHNCCYRYNISVNDGARIKGKNGAIQDGKTLWLSGYTGANQKRLGPFNSYIYNNTIYVKKEMRSAFSITRSSDGILIANNIFFIAGRTETAGDDQDKRTLPPSAAVKRVIIGNNLYLRADTLPGDLPLQDGQSLHDSRPIVANPQFRNPGGLDPADYIPANREAVKNRGIRIERIPGDSAGVKGGLDVAQDFFGNPIAGLPDMGAIEMK
jgi:hypothetical protein